MLRLETLVIQWIRSHIQVVLCMTVITFEMFILLHLYWEEHRIVAEHKILC